jgi:hypothetical protein
VSFSGSVLASVSIGPREKTRGRRASVTERTSREVRRCCHHPQAGMRWFFCTVKLGGMGSEGYTTAPSAQVMERLSRP